MKWFTRIAVFFAIVTFVLWFLGVLLSDRWVWSQWLAWIPTPVVLFFFVIAGAFCICTKKRAFALAIGGGAIVVSIWCCCVEHHLLSNRGNAGAIKIVAWTMSHSKKAVAKQSADIVVELNGDITLLTHGWFVRGEPAIREWLGQSGHKVINSQFTLLTKFTPLKVQTLIASDGIYISEFILDTTAILGDVLVVWAIDLPSAVSSSKMEIANRVLRLLQTVDTTEPDIVIGDFNMTRNGFAIQTMFPELHDVAIDSGVGVLASFPVEYPLYHIDHVLIGSQLRAANYKLINPHIGRHRIQVAEINP
jgi:hypothetical protein